MLIFFTNLVVGQEGDQRGDQEDALGELEEDPEEEAPSLVDPACVEVLVVALGLQEEADGNRPSGAGCPPTGPCPRRLSPQTHQCIPPLPLLRPLRESTDLKSENVAIKGGFSAEVRWSVYACLPAILNIMACRGVMAFDFFTSLLFLPFPIRVESAAMSANRTLRPKHTIYTLLRHYL